MTSGFENETISYGAVKLEFHLLFFILQNTGLIDAHLIALINWTIESTYIVTGQPTKTEFWIACRK
jgi:hypothetical protein